MVQARDSAREATIAASSAAGNENQRVALKLSASLTSGGLKPGESLVVILSGMEDGTAFSSGSRRGATGNEQLVNVNELDILSMIPPAGFSGNFTIKIAAHVVSAVGSVGLAIPTTPSSTTRFFVTIKAKPIAVAPSPAALAPSPGSSQGGGSGGSSTTAPCAGTEGRTCSGFGQCDADKGTCQCRRGFMGKTCETSVIVLTIRIAGDLAAVTKSTEARAAFEKKFAGEVATSLKLDSPSLVHVLEIKAGSIVVTFEILVPEDEMKTRLAPFMGSMGGGAGGASGANSSSSSAGGTTFTGKTLVSGQIGGAVASDVDRVPDGQTSVPSPQGGDSNLGVIIGAAAGGGGFVLVVIIIVVAVLLRRRRIAGRSGGGRGTTTANVVVEKEGMEMVGQRFGESHGSVDMDNPLHSNPMFKKRSNAGMT